MKRILSVVVAVAVFGFMGSVARAEEEGHGEGKGPEVVVGLKTWMNKLKREIPGAENMTSNSIMLIGPSIEVECAKAPVFVEASYLMSASDYKVSEGGVDTKFSRRDIDLAVGYQFNHYAGVFAGYRNSELKDKETDAKETNAGLLAGVRGSYPVNEAFSVFGKASYLFTRLKTDAGTENAPGIILAAGVKYDFTKQVAAALGYQVESTKTKDTKVKDTFGGVTLDVTYAF